MRGRGQRTPRSSGWCIVLIGSAILARVGRRATGDRPIRLRASHTPLPAHAYFISQALWSASIISTHHHNGRHPEELPEGRLRPCPPRAEGEECCKRVRSSCLPWTQCSNALAHALYPSQATSQVARAIEWYGESRLALRTSGPMQHSESRSAAHLRLPPLLARVGPDRPQWLGERGCSCDGRVCVPCDLALMLRGHSAPGTR